MSSESGVVSAPPSPSHNRLIRALDLILNAIFGTDVPPQHQH